MALGCFQTYLSIVDNRHLTCTTMKTGPALQVTFPRLVAVRGGADDEP